jgi:PPOX class probable F420-dependent enzyme
MMTLAAAFALGRAEQGLAVVSTLRADGTIQSTLVNAGVLTPPQGHREVLAFVTYGPVKLANLRVRPQVTVTFRSGWKWASIEGNATLLGPQDGDLDPDRLRLLLRDIFAAAGGTHDDWDEYDRVMREQGRTAVLVEPTRIYGS